METRYREPLKLGDNEFYREHSQAFDLYQRFLEYTFHFPKVERDEYAGLLVAMAYRLFEQGRGAFEATLVLCNHGYAVQSFSLCRELFEALINLRYLEDNPKEAEKLERYTQYQSLLYRKVLTRLPRDSIFCFSSEKFGTWSEELEEKLRQFEKEFTEKYKWCGLGVRQMAAKVGLEGDYELLYLFLSAFAHQTAPSFFQVDAAEPNTIKGRRVPSSEGIFDALLISGHCFDPLFRCWLRIMGELDQQTEKEIAEIVQVLCCPNNPP
jgi:hypothetical protein